MGIFSNLFSKKPCELCGKEVGVISRAKTNDGIYICTDCKKDASAYFKIERHSFEQLTKHLEYMTKQDEFYNNVFKNLEPEKVDRIVTQGFYGIAFADEIAMFEIIHPEANKRNKKEVFRYDQIRDFEIYGKENTSQEIEQGKKKYRETGIKIYLNCAEDINNSMASEEAKKSMHPYALEFEIPVKKNVDNKDGGLAIHHLNKIFGRPDATVIGHIKESFVGTGHQQTGYAAANDAMSALGSFAVGKLTGNDSKIEEAKEKMNAASEKATAYISENRTRYAQIADEVEKGAMGQTFRDFLYQ